MIVRSDRSSGERSVCVSWGTAFYTLRAGYKLKTIVNEVFGEGAVEYMKAGGFRLQTTDDDAPRADAAGV